MKKILFICHGNICRSTMAQFVMEYLANQSPLKGQLIIDSKATSTEELGNPPHRGTVQKLRAMNIPVLPHRASQFKFADYDDWDYIIGMDEENYRNLMRMTHGDPQGKVSYLLDFTDSPGDIADPWYTGNFDQTFDDVLKGCQGLLAHLASL